MPNFRLPRALSARWQAESDGGLTHLDLRVEAQSIVADAVVIGSRSAARFGAHYRIVCREDWTTLRLDIETTDGRTLSVTSDGDGRWSDVGAHRLPIFDGCIDVDLEGSPFTNTLPIRRLDLDQTVGAVEFRMLYVPFDTFTPFVDRQRYRCTAPRRYRYEAVDGPFTADMTVDDDGLVVDYPPLFHRLAPQE